MTSSELDWTSVPLDGADGTDSTRDEGEEGTDSTRDEEEEGTDSTQDADLRFDDSDRTDLAQEQVGSLLDTGQTARHVNSGGFIVRDIAVERPALLTALPADSDAAYSQWLADSGLAPAKLSV